LSTSDVIELAVAAGTALLAIATFRLAHKASDQADATLRLAEAAERQLQASTTPIIRIARIGEPNEVDISTVNKGSPTERLVVRLDNRGSAAAEIERCILTPGGEGKPANDELDSPIMEPNSELDIDFQPSDEDKVQHMDREVGVQLQIYYLAVASGVRYGASSWVYRREDGDDERWKLIREIAPYRLAEAPIV